LRQPQSERGQIASAISTRIVSLHAKAYGRGPTKARTFLTPFYALCLMEDVFTTAERTLIAHGKPGNVRDTRLAFQETMRDEFVAIVEEANGRKVRAFMSQITTEPEVAAELFLFEPDQDDVEPAEPV
jgi:uncharacterized protein YbcI